MSNIINQSNSNVKGGGRNLFFERSPDGNVGAKSRSQQKSSRLVAATPHSNNNIPRPKIIFLGTPQFAVPILEKLAQSEFKPSAVFCAPDKPVGRKQILTPPPVKVAAEKFGIPVFQPSSVSEFVIRPPATPSACRWRAGISDLKPDLIISAAFGIILPKTILDSPRYGCLNIHPSLLPKYRGASPIQYTILNGDSETGITIIKMDEKIDHGAILVTDHLSLITQNYTTPELSEKLAEMGAELLLKALPDWLAGKITPMPQDESQATYTKIIKKTDGCVDWKKSAREIERQIRAFTPWPGAFTRIMNNESGIMNIKGIKRQSPAATGDSNMEYMSNTLYFDVARTICPSGALSSLVKIKILEADISKNTTQKQIGEIFLDDNNELAIQTGNDVLIIKKLQLEGGKPMTAAEFLRGHKEIIGQFFS